MAQNPNFIDELMNLDALPINAFQEPEKTSSQNEHVYKTNPTKVSSEVAPDGHYRSKIRVIYNPMDAKQSIVHTAKYAMNDAEGFFMVDSKLAMGDRSCPIFTNWKTLHFSNDTTEYEINGQKWTKKTWGDKMFDKNEANWCLIQVIEDKNQPDKEGQFMVMKLPKAIFEKLNAKMNPTDKSQTHVDLMNYLFGPMLNMDVTPGPDDKDHPERKTREIKYTLCDFDTDPQPIVTVTGESLFNDEEMDIINDYDSNKKILLKANASKKKKDEALANCKEMADKVRALMEKAVNYVSENAINLVEEVSYKEPTGHTLERMNNWLMAVTNMQDPTVARATTVAETGAPKEVETATENPADELPF